MAAIRFITQLVEDSGYTFIFFPRSALGTNTRVRVTGKINGKPFATTAMPWREGKYVITVNAQMRRSMGLVGGEQVEVELEPDTGPPLQVEVPADLATGLNKQPSARAAFDRMPPSHRKRYVAWIEEAKRPETRARRVERAVEMILKSTGPFRPR